MRKIFRFGAQMENMMFKACKIPLRLLSGTLCAAVLLNAPADAAGSSSAAPLSAEHIQLHKDQQKYHAYLPKNYVLFEALQGDLNKDGKADAVLIVKRTDPNMWLKNQFGEKVDRNRRGVIVLLNDKGSYQKILQNLSVFSSENEDGGVYFAPELAPSIEKGLLKIHYAHGRYGYWTYTFRLEGRDMRLIGYDDSSNHGPVVDSETSINFLTQKKRHRDNLNKHQDDDEPHFKETWSRVHAAPIYLSSIKDFDALDFSDIQ